jgi:hypothetical protein
MARAVCFHGQVSCSFCGNETVAPWRRALGRLLAPPRCPCCGRKQRRSLICPLCYAAGYEPLTLFEVADA